MDLFLDWNFSRHKYCYNIAFELGGSKRVLQKNFRYIFLLKLINNGKYNGVSYVNLSWSLENINKILQFFDKPEFW